MVRSPATAKAIQRKPVLEVDLREATRWWAGAVAGEARAVPTANEGRLAMLPPLRLEEAKPSEEAKGSERGD